MRNFCNFHFEIFNFSQFSTGNILDNFCDETNPPSLPLPLFPISNNNIINITINRLKQNLKIKWFGKLQNYFLQVWIPQKCMRNRKQTKHSLRYMFFVENFVVNHRKRKLYKKDTFCKRLIVPNKPTQIPIDPINSRNK